MSRRDLPNIPPSLHEVKELEKQSKERISSAEAQLSIVTNAIAAAETQKAQVEAELASAEVSRGAKLAEIAVVEDTLSEAKDELRQVEGQLLAARSEVEKAVANVATVREIHTAKEEQLTKIHKEQMDGLARTQTDARKSVEEAEKALAKKQLELKGTEEVIARFKKEEERLEKEVLPKVTAAKAELEVITRDVLIKQGELQEASVKYTEMNQRFNTEKAKYEEVSSLRLAEEQRIEAELKKLFDKEGEVENKLRSLRTLQQGIDQATIRLERKEEEITLREHLSKQKEVILT